MRFIKKVMERGTITLPSDVREALDVKEGDIVEFEIVGVVKKGPAERETRRLKGVARPERRDPPGALSGADPKPS